MGKSRFPPKKFYSLNYWMKNNLDRVQSRRVHLTRLRSRPPSRISRSWTRTCCCCTSTRSAHTPLQRHGSSSRQTGRSSRTLGRRPETRMSNQWPILCSLYDRKLRLYSHNIGNFLVNTSPLPTRLATRHFSYSFYNFF